MSEVLAQLEKKGSSGGSSSIIMSSADTGFNGRSYYTSGETSITATGLPTATTMMLFVNTGGYKTLTLTGRSTQYTSLSVRAVKADGTNETVSNPTNTLDVSNYIALSATFFTQATFTATLS